MTVATWIDEYGVTHAVAIITTLNETTHAQGRTACGIRVAGRSIDHVLRNRNRDRVVNCIACIAADVGEENEESEEP